MYFNARTRLLIALLVPLALPTLAGESIRFGQPVKPETQASLANALALSSDRPARELAEGAEVVLISGYEPSNVSTNGAKVKVLIDRLGAKVLLVLSSYEKITWEVAGSPGTQITGIVAAGYHRPTVLTTAKTVGYLTDLPYAYETENAKFKDLLAQLNRLFGVSRIDAFRGQYAIPSEVTIKEPDRPRPELSLNGPAVQKPNTNFSFRLLGTDFQSSKWSLTGPQSKAGRTYIDKGKVALSDSEAVRYAIAEHGIEISDSTTDKSSIVPLPSNFPDFSWATDIALDTKRGIATIVTLGGEGFLYRFDTRKKSWIDFRSLNNEDIYALSYDYVADRYVAWTDDGNLIFISGNGDALFAKRVIDRLPGFGRIYDKGNGRPPRVTVAPHGNDIALIYIANGVVERIWYYSLSADSAVLTYQSAMGGKQN